ncbi:FUSC family protein [Gordonia sp. NPDC003504]
MDTDDPRPQPPARPSMSGALFAVPDVRGRWPAAIRAGLAFAIPAAVLYLLGFDRDCLLATLGGFAALYGEKRPYRVRWRAVSTAGAVLVATTAGYGALGAWAGPSATSPENLVVIIALVAGAAVTAFCLNALRLGPPGPFFFVLTAAIASVVTRHGVDLTPLVLASGAGAVASLVVSMAPALWRPHGPETAATAAAIRAVEDYLDDNRSTAPAHRHGVALSTLHAWSVLHDAAATNSALAQQLWESMRRWHGARQPVDLAPPLPRPSVAHRLRIAARRFNHAEVTTARVASAAFAAGAISIATGLSRPDWAILGAVLVLQLGPDRIRGVVRGAHRLIGTVAGLGVFVALHLLDLGVPTLIVVIAALNLLIELTIVGNYAVAVTFITPLAMLMGDPAVDITIPVRDRFLETLLGVVCAIAAMWLVLGRAHRRTWRYADEAVVGGIDDVLDGAATQPVGSPRSMTLRRDLQWSLLEAEMAATDAAGNEPGWARRRWAAHVALCQVGHEVLTWCWRADPDRPLDTAIAGMLSERRLLLTDHAPPGR